MKSSSFAKAITLGCLVLVGVPVACGDDTSTPSKKPNTSMAGAAGEKPSAGGADSGGGAGGAGGAGLPPGLSNSASTIECGMSCSSAKIGALNTVVYVDPCCAGDACGLTTTFLGTAGLAFGTSCIAKDQAGEPDDSCPAPDPLVVPVSGGGMLPLDPFVACCRAATGTCGVQVNKVTLGGGVATLGDLQLGCVDSAPFFPGAAPKSCGAGAGGAGGAGGVSGGGAPGGGAGGASVGGAGAGGAGG